MPDAGLTNSKIVAAYRERTPGSARLAEEARGCFPSGITHDARNLSPYGIYVDHAKGPRKWDVDGNEYVDYFGGHGALLLGHNHPQVTQGVHAALERGTHFGANHPLEVRWAEAVKRLVPCAERLRFTSSGTEATLMALRLARASTGRHKIARLMGHFHGWHDHMSAGYTAHFDGTPTTGVLKEIAENVVLLRPDDPEAMRATLVSDRDIAAVILEPTGASFGNAPLKPGTLEALREATLASGALLIFDEVVTGFRVAPGGAQAHFGVTPDLATLAKILAGGMPGGAVVGRKDILDYLDFDVAKAKGREKIAHQGTYNANPVSAAAGIETLRIVAESDACARANAYGAELRRRLNDVLEGERVPWAVFGSFSGFYFFLNAKREALSPHAFDPLARDPLELVRNPPELAQKLRLAMLLGGVDLNGRPGGLVSATHGEAELAATTAALAKAISLLRADGELPSA
ncbi:MAG: aspartate aminotransferase family protein [Alphaproteobacteria bacterium]